MYLLRCLTGKNLINKTITLSKLKPAASYSTRARKPDGIKVSFKEKNPLKMIVFRF